MTMTTRNDSTSGTDPNKDNWNNWKNQTPPGYDKEIPPGDDKKMAVDPQPKAKSDDSKLGDSKKV